MGDALNRCVFGGSFLLGDVQLRLRKAGTVTFHKLRLVSGGGILMDKALGYHLIDGSCGRGYGYLGGLGRGLRVDGRLSLLYCSSHIGAHRSVASFELVILPLAFKLR